MPPFVQVGEDSAIEETPSREPTGWLHGDKNEDRQEKEAEGIQDHR